MDIDESHPLYPLLNAVVRGAASGTEKPAVIPNDIDRARAILMDFGRTWDDRNSFQKLDLIKVSPQSTRWKTTAGFMLVLDVYPETAWRQNADCSCCIESYDMRVIRLDPKGSPHEMLAHSRDFVLVERLAL